MSLDNSPVTSDRYKTPIVNTPLLEGPGSAPGDSTMLSSACVPMLHDAPSPSPAFVPRNFPPPALAGVPVDYIVHKLHQMAPKYWDKTDTADCTISKILFFFSKKKTPLLMLDVISRPDPSPCGALKASSRYAPLQAGPPKQARSCRAWPKGDGTDIICCSSYIIQGTSPQLRHTLLVDIVNSFTWIICPPSPHFFEAFSLA
jgi:hypothetical protein